MHTILIAHRDAEFAEHLATQVRAWGYRVIECPGPLPPALRCIRCDKGYCPLTEGADLMIYDPHLIACDAAGNSHNLAIDSALAHPEVPLLLAWSSATLPDAGTLREIRSAAPWVHAAAREPAALRGQIQGLLAAAALFRSGEEHRLMTCFRGERRAGVQGVPLRRAPARPPLPRHAH